MNHTIGLFSHATSSLLLAGLLYAVFLNYSRRYLQLWSMSWTCLGLVNCVLFALELMRPDSVVAGRAGLAIADSLGFFQVYFLVMGVLALLGQDLSKGARRSCAIVGLVFAIVLSLAFSNGRGGGDAYPLFGVRSLCIVPGYLFAVYGVARLRRMSAGVGVYLFGTSAALFAAQHLHYGILSLLEPFAATPTAHLPYMSFVELLFTGGMGFGAVIWLLEDERREVMEVHVALRDSEEQLRQSQKMELLGRLAGGIAHDFNNLLVGIIGYSDLLEESLEGSQKRDASEIRKAADRAAQLTRQLLAFSRRQVSTPKVVELNAVIRDIGGLLSRLIGSGVQLDLDLCAESVKINIDPIQLEQVVLNLALNARDAMPDGGLLRITTLVDTPPSSHSPDGVAILKVIDTGTGIDEATRARVFEPFFTTKPSGEGTGLGLSVVYGIIQQANGDISVASTLGRGTTFEVRFPRSEEDELGRTTLPVDDHPVKLVGTVLVVDDQEQVLRVVSGSLRRLGMTVRVAASAQEARVVLAEQPIDVLVCDVVMPDESGLQMAAWVRETRPNVAIVLMSGYADREAIEAARARLGVRFLSKPFSSRDLAACMSEVVNETIRA